MLRVYFIVSMLLLGTLVCSMTQSSSRNEAIATSIPTITFATQTTPITTAPTATPTATATTPPTATTASSGSGSGTISLPPGCTVRTDWQLYTVVSGDTLGKIAERTGSTVTALATANCLRDPNSLFVGQQIRVPYIPPTTTKAPTITPTITPTTPVEVQVIGTLQFTPIVGAAEGGYELEQGKWVTVTWTGVPAGYHGIADFNIHYPGGVIELLSRDESFVDGAQMTWLVPANLRGNIEAVFYPAGAGIPTWKSPATSVISQSAPTQQGFPVISSYLHADAGNFQLQPGATIQIRWLEVPTHTAQVDFIYKTADGATQVIGSAAPDQDGAIITWTVPENLNGSLFALAFSPTNNLLGQSYAHNIYSSTAAE